MDTAELIKWFKLCNVKGLGPRKIIRLFDCFKNIDSIWNAEKNELLRSCIFNEQMVKEWTKLQKASPENFEKIIIECKQNEISIIPLISKEYPPQLKIIPNPPVNLFLQGNKQLLKTKKIAIVGSRKSDERSKKWAYNTAIDLVKNGLCVVSGGAIGVDYEAHKAALDASGNTICIMGPGLLNLFPERNIELFNKIKKKGLLISENLPSFPGSRIALLQRNRITSGTSDGLIAVTGTSGHGVMTQLKHANDQKIPVFCPKLDYGFIPNDGIKEVKEKYNIVEIQNIEPILEMLRNIQETYIIQKQTKLF